MIENSTQGLTLLDAAHTVVVTGVQQPVLAPWAPGPDGFPRQVAVELLPVSISAGRRGVEVRLDGWRAGELTPVLSERYLPYVDDVVRGGGRPAGVALVAFGPHELEMELRLPDVSAEATTAMSVARPRPVPPPPPRRRSPYLIGAGVLALLLGVGTVIGTGNRGSDLADARPVVPVVPTTVPPSSTPAALAPLPPEPAEVEIAQPTTVRRTLAPTPEPAPPTPPSAPAPPPATVITDPPPPPTPAITTPTTRGLLDPAPTTERQRVEPYRSCRRARADGASNIPRSDPRYNPDLDEDGDGVMCET